MTLACGFKGVRGAPILIGDILISDFENGDAQRVALPTLGRIADIAPEWGNHPISGARQKLTIISPNLAIGWSGSLITARMLISDLIKESKNRLFTMQTLDEYLNNYNRHTDLSEIQLVGFIIDNNGFGYVGWRCHQFTDALGDTVLICGSATDDQTVEKAISNVKLEFPINHQTNAGLSDSVLAIGLVGQLMMEEMRNGQSLSTFFYGGGYEIIIASQNGFCKLDKIGYMYWHCLIESETEFNICPVKLLSLSYRDMALLYRTLTFEWPDGKNAPLVKSQDVHIIDPANSISVPPACFKLPSLDFFAIANIFLIRNSSNQHETATRAGFMLSVGQKDGQKPFDLIENGHEIEMTFTQEFLNSTAQLILSGNSSIKLIS